MQAGLDGTLLRPATLGTLFVVTLSCGAQLVDAAPAPKGPLTMDEAGEIKRKIIDSVAVDSACGLLSLPPRRYLHITLKSVPPVQGASMDCIQEFYAFFILPL